MYELEFCDDLGRKMVIPLLKREMTIGREPSCDIVLTDPDVSRRHAILTIEDSGVRLRDENSTNGTYVNHRFAQEETPIKPGSDIIIGSNQFYLKKVDDYLEDEDIQNTLRGSLGDLRSRGKPIETADEEMPDWEAVGPGEEPLMEQTMVSDFKDIVANIYRKKINIRCSPSVELLHGGKKIAKFLLTPGTHTVGRGRKCNIRLEDAQASKVHGTFVVSAREVAYNDEGSRNGSFINGSNTPSAILKNNDEVKVGETSLLFIQPRPAPAEPPAPKGLEPSFEMPPTDTFDGGVYSRLAEISAISNPTSAPWYVRYPAYVVILWLSLMVFYLTRMLLAKFWS